MRSVSEQPSAAGVADQLHGKISEKLASAVWIRPVGRLSGHFTRVTAVGNWPFPGDQLDATVALGGLLYQRPLLVTRGNAVMLQRLKCRDSLCLYG
jgi:hypothetical protein